MICLNLQNTNLNTNASLKHLGQLKVIALQGQFRDISKKNMGIDTDTFDCKYELISSKKKSIQNMSGHTRCSQRQSDSPPEPFCL
jgi:hypothetical protein